MSGAPTPAARAARSPQGFPVTYEASLVEEAVLRAEGAMASAERTLFRRERDRLYEVGDSDEREARFEELHGRWFVRLGLDRPLQQALSEAPILLAGTGGCLVARAASHREEAADLFDSAEPGAEPPKALVRLCPEALLEPERLLRLLRHELLHLADMVDPAFGYERELPISEWGPAYADLLRDRYRALWDATIDGRLFRRGWLTPAEREARLEEFARALPMLGKRTEEAFARWFDDPSPTHRAIVDFILGPPGQAVESGRCPVCRFPSRALEGHAGRLTSEALLALRADHPCWRAEHGICAQCADLYLARAAPFA